LPRRRGCADRTAFSPSAGFPAPGRRAHWCSLGRSAFVGEPHDPHRLQDPQRAQRVAVGGVLRTLKAHRYMALSAEVVDLMRLHLLDDPDQVGAVGEIAVVVRA